MSRPRQPPVVIEPVPVEFDPPSYLKSLDLPPYLPTDTSNRSSAFGIIVEVLGWIMIFSFIFLLGMALNWYLYSRHERVDRVFPEELEMKEAEEEEVEQNSIDRQAMEEYFFEEIKTFEVLGVNYYVRFDEVESFLAAVKIVYLELFD